MIAKTIVTIKVIDYEPIQALANALTDPGLKHRTPMGIVQAGPVFLHATDRVAVIPNRRAIGIFFKQIQWIIDRPKAKRLLVPKFAVKLKEAPWSLIALGVAHQKLDVEMTDYQRVEQMQLLV